MRLDELPSIQWRVTYIHPLNGTHRTTYVDCTFPPTATEEGYKVVETEDWETPGADHYVNER